MSCLPIRDNRNSPPVTDPKDQKIALMGMTLEQLTSQMNELNEPTFRANQLFGWLYRSCVDTFSEMRNIPNNLKQKFEKKFIVHPLEVVHVTGSSSEPTQKFLFKLQTGEMVESVLMRDGDRTTICVSSQIGCAVDCDFCATASMGFQKNLSVGEIVDQFILVSKASLTRITNVVFMGMGEPFLNYDRVITAADLMNHQDGIKLGAQRITISTVGIVPKIKRYVEEKHRYKLAISLNGSSQVSRLKTMPIAKKYPLDKLLESIDYFSSRSRHPVTLEYVLMAGVTDAKEDAHKLLDMLNGRRCKLNVIPYNEIGGKYSHPSDERIETFINVLEKAHFPVTVRRSKGTDISAGCGQLAVMESAA
ncbi:MAG: 23S rRNA (adenine(2503)-C(2))-methyltransferase RlmN [Candidatus Marinimicrobia bacterium]|nr:23S rRNA (adenine(2503)-C(2))-methyltransferase RlmN [Candidatus Neomarinimicrobiota bacterium]HBN45578.1 23S rRNA (adenine(2503)-C(2))-methyltransferase RlmN [Candidatus Neomarinimicrobiota bacterium]